MKTKIFFNAIMCIFASVVCAQDYFYAYYSDGTVQKFPTLNADSISLIAKDKCKASSYKQVVIGTQTWMAENYGCNKYDTESEAYAEGRFTVPTTSELNVYTPYYVDATDINNWDQSSKNNYYLIDSQISKLGYLYNWSAAVGLGTEEEAKRITPFEGNRQGICPNGWHVPSREEWTTLVDFLGGYTVAGEYLKSNIGWVDEGNGTDDYGFSALPACSGSGPTVHSIGQSAYFCTSTPIESNSKNNYMRLASSGFNWMSDISVEKITAISVRCVKN